MRKVKAIGILVLVATMFALGGCFLFPNHPPIAAFTPIYGVDTEDPLVVRLDASASTDPDGDEIVAYSWTFFQEDGQSANVTILPQEASKMTTDPVITVRFPVEGNYTVTLVVRDARGKDSDPVSLEVTVPYVPTSPTE